MNCFSKYFPDQKILPCLGGRTAVSVTGRKYFWLGFKVGSTKMNDARSDTVTLILILSSACLSNSSEIKKGVPVFL